VATSTADDDRPASQIMFRLVHYQALILLTLASYSVLSHYLHTWVLSGVGVLLGALFLIVRMSLRRHDRSLCLACARDFPLNAAEQATGPRRGALRRFHLINDHLALTFLVLSLILIGSFRWWWLMPVMCLLLAVEARDDHQHRLLKRYCPYCPRDGDDDPEVAPVPTPDPAVEARR
jgi:hypothetical protein